jgi:hypothetical protein
MAAELDASMIALAAVLAARNLHHVPVRLRDARR